MPLLARHLSEVPTFWLPQNVCHNAGLASRALHTGFVLDTSQKFSELDAIDQLRQQVQYLLAMKEFAVAKTDIASRLVASNRELQAETDMAKATEAARDLLAQLPATLARCNKHLQKLRVDRATLLHLRRWGPVGEPDMEHQVLDHIRQDARAVHHDTEEGLRLMHRVSTLTALAEQQARLVRPILRDSQVRAALPEEEEKDAALGDLKMEEGHLQVDPSFMDPAQTQGRQLALAMSSGEPTTEEANTSAGCSCDPRSQCAFQGRDFTWCRVGGGTCKLLRQDSVGTADPGGADHTIYRTVDAWPATNSGHERTGAVWDYCISKPRPPGENAAPRTAHGGACLWRGALYRRYSEDSAYKDGAGNLDIAKIPLRDRLAVQAMDQNMRDPDTHGVCDIVDGSKGFAVCPAVPDPDKPEMASHGWFSARSWDFCSDADRSYRPSPETGTVDQERLTSIVDALPPAPESPKPVSDDAQDDDVIEEAMPLSAAILAESRASIHPSGFCRSLPPYRADAPRRSTYWAAFLPQVSLRS